VEEADRGPDEHRKFITTNLAPILGMLTSVMSSPDANLEDDDDGGWGPYQAAQNAFVEVTRAVGGSAMVGAVLPWVQQNIAAPEWQKREAASMVMGMLQEHTPGSDILTVDGQALHLLWPRLLAPAGTNAREAHDKVREGLVFFIAKAYLFHGPSLCPTKERVKEALANLCTLLASEAVPATRKLAATAINYLFTKFVQDRDEEGTLGALFERVGGAPAGPVTTVFSGANGIFDILTLLVRRGVEATAADETEVSVECFSAVNSVLEASGVEDVGTVAALLRDVGMAKLTESVAKCMPSVDRAPLSADAKHKERELQERYLGLVHTILNKEQEFLRADPPFAGLTAALTPLAQQLVSLVLALVDCDMASSEAWSVLGLLITSNLFSAPEDPPDRAGLTFWCRAEVLGAVHARIAKGLSSLEDADRLIQSFYSAGDVLRTLRERAPPELVTVYVDRAIAVLQDPNVDSVVKPVALEFFTDYAGCLCVARSILYRVLDKVDSAAQQENGVRLSSPAPRHAAARALRALNDAPAPPPLSPPRRTLTTRTSARALKRYASRAAPRGAPSSLSTPSPRMPAATPRPRSGKRAWCARGRSYWTRGRGACGTLWGALARGPWRGKLRRRWEPWRTPSRWSSKPRCCAW
jgi:hypothetical protein